MSLPDLRHDDGMPLDGIDWNLLQREGLIGLCAQLNLHDPEEQSRLAEYYAHHFAERMRMRCRQQGFETFQAEFQEFLTRFAAHLNNLKWYLSEVEGHDVGVWSALERVRVLPCGDQQEEASVTVMFPPARKPKAAMDQRQRGVPVLGSSEGRPFALAV